MPVNITSLYELKMEDNYDFYRLISQNKRENVVTEQKPYLVDDLFGWFDPNTDYFIPFDESLPVGYLDQY
eukprot:Pgem_evm1s6045